MAAKNVKKSFVIAYALMAVLALIALIMYLNGNSYISTAPTAKDEFFQSYNVHASLITWLTVGGIACAVLSALSALFADQKGIVKLCTDVLRVAAPVLVIVALAYFLTDRVDGFGYVYGSNLALGKDDAFTAGSKSIQGIVFYCVTWLVGIVSAFLGFKKKA